MYGHFRTLADLIVGQNVVSQLKSNPGNSFRIGKRFNVDWVNVFDLIIEDDYVTGKQCVCPKLYGIVTPFISPSIDMLQDIKVLRNSEAFPKPEDLYGVAFGLARLQKTYALNSFDLANGKIRDTQYK